MNELAELKELLACENAGLIPHVASELGVKRYIKNADRIKRYLPKGRVLDWGCGLGQMTYLLKNRGFEVTSYDVDCGGRAFLQRIGQPLILAADPVKLPFPDSSFDAVLSSGVLEHVAEPLASLKEVSRVLKDQGYFFVFMLPNKYSYIEYISDRLGRGDHPVKYSEKQIRELLEKFNFDVLSVTYKGLLPYNLKGLPAGVREFYHIFDRWIGYLDWILSRLPLLGLLSTNIEIVARKK